MAENKRDFYEVLGVSKDAAEADIKKAYRTLAKKYHPDVNPGDKNAEQKFKEINEAYSVLSDADKKAKYDQYGHAAFDPSMGGGSGYEGGFGGFGNMGGFGDIFESFFGGGMGGSSSARRNSPARGDDLTTKINLTFEEAVFGCKKEINYNRTEKCSECSGSGAAKGSSAETCSTCRGSGQIRVTQRTILGAMQTMSTCNACQGTGKIIKNPCPGCRGTGRVRNRKTFEISVPAGIDDGQKIVLSRQGNEGINGGPAGDLYVFVSVGRHDIFVRDGLNIYCEVPISFTEAALGAEITVPTLEGSSAYKISEGTQTGTKYTLKGKGVRQVNGRGIGDLIFTVVIDTPKNLSKEQKDLLKKFNDSCDDSKYSKKQAFFKKIINKQGKK